MSIMEGRRSISHRYMSRYTPGALTRACVLVWSALLIPYSMCDGTHAARHVPVSFPVLAQLWHYVCMSHVVFPRRDSCTASLC